MPSPDFNDAVELAALYAAGALTPEEAASFEARLAAGDEGCRAELEKLGPVQSALFAAVEPVTPPPGVRARLMQRIGEAAATAPLVGIYVQRQSAGEWQEVGLPGVTKRVLFRDAGRNLVTFLLRLAPGAEVPPHAHHGVEECYVVEGDLHSYDTVLVAGDYTRAEAGTLHGASRSVGGCVLLLQVAQCPTGE